MRSLIATLFFLLVSPSVFAVELDEYYTSIRALGMGNAYSAVAADADSLFYNPAGLARVNGFNVMLANVSAGADRQDIVTTVQDVQDTTKYAATLKGLYGKNIWASGGGMSAITAQGLGFAAFDKLEVSARLSNPAAPNLDVRYLSDYGFIGGFAVDILPSFHFGFSGMRISRTGAVLPIGVATLGSLTVDDLKNQLENKGVGYGGTMGFLGVLPNTLGDPRASLVFKNIGTTNFTRDSGANFMGTLDSEIIIGFAVDVPLGPAGQITASFDYKYFNLASEQLGKKIHLGLELNLLMLSLRGGFNQGYYTAGAGLDLKFLKVDAVTYGVEMGEFPGQLEDRRYLASVTIEFGFDGSLFSGGPSKTKTGNGGRGGPSSGIKPRR